MAAPVPPDEQSLRADRASARFLSGQDRGRWRLHRLDWPFVFIGVFAGDGQEFVLRLDCRGFPTAAPTGTFWDLETGMRLPDARWPRVGERMSLAFRPDWKGGMALYVPCDRESLVGHDAWPTQYPQLIWNPAKGISHYLEVVHDLLQGLDHERAAA
jgi:hypothetical protein